MTNLVVIEDIEEMRRREGIDDVELRDEIRGLGVGDYVLLTFLFGTKAFETLPVRITSIRGPVFRGKLTRGPALTSLSPLTAGSVVAFGVIHIHSVPKQQPNRRARRPGSPNGDVATATVGRPRRSR